ncbi:MAG: polymer-forming cytoskeletal protein [Myxococcota bacterium]
MNIEDGEELGEGGEGMDTSRDSSEGRSRAGEAVLVPTGGAFEGQVAVVGTTRIEGSVRGSLRGPGHLRVGPEARVEGRIECESLESRGEIVGPVAVRTRARLAGRGRLDGDLHAPTVLLEDDAVWNGRAIVGCEAEPEPEPAPAEADRPSRADGPR